jgi:hypothetical protein
MIVLALGRVDSCDMLSLILFHPLYVPVCVSVALVTPPPLDSVSTLTVYLFIYIICMVICAVYNISLDSCFQVAPINIVVSFTHLSVNCPCFKVCSRVESK